ncbi:hypothetical protein EAVNNN508_00846 [Elizabethkingia anophelis]|nr:hypothetical protein EAVNVB490_01315 [Elizabethkingia anophelis]CAI9670242.1 hypothetical protein EAVNNN508_01315 [Elizabethkingia anophelis]CAI9673483.1 hypothetical protein EAVNVB490_00848 [Elizabethkingia anophelis]CAI9678964.1 hypothetical protein EAVNNN508_00846 [Elizabethkingia anophelis]SPW16961.1 Uncharacterised protein [Elizabethkingia anophelis]
MKFFNNTFTSKIISLKINLGFYIDVIHIVKS